MSSFRRRLAAAGISAAVGLLGIALVCAEPFPGVSLTISKESAPPGAIAQVKVFVTEPKPISTGSTSFSFAAYGDVVGIALMSPGQDTFGVALVRGANLALSWLSTGASYGMATDYPILTIAGHVPASAPIGTKFPLAIDPAALQLWDPLGVLYPVDVKPGHLVTGTGVAIGDVSPGSAVLAAGDTVTISGTNFVPGTAIRFSEVKLAAVQYIDSGRIDVVLAQPARMHGMMVKANNPDGSQDVYFSYQRTRTASPSADSLLQLAVPLVPPIETTSAALTLPATAPTAALAVAVQNIESIDAVVALDLLDASGARITSASLAVPASQFVVREMSELFGFVPSAGSTIRVTSATPIQVLGIGADRSTGTAWPIVAQ
jgi:IPT/TIG domain-containing protein